MKLTEYVGNLIVGFLKFTDFYDELLNGELYMNSLKYFIDLEEEEGKKGRGDRLEAAHVIADSNLRFYNQDTNEFQFEMPVGRMHFSVDGDKERPVYCMTTLTSDDFVLEEETDDYYIFGLSLPNGVKEEMVEKFAEDLVFINSVVLDRIVEICKKINLDIIGGKVAYDNYKINNSTRMKTYRDNPKSVYFWKDKCFENQRESRIVVLNDGIETPYTLKIGDIRDIAQHYKAKEFLDKDGFKLTIFKSDIEELRKRSFK